MTNPDPTPDPEDSRQRRASDDAASAGGPDAASRAAAFEVHRGLLEGVAYRMLGERADADDVVQEAWLRWAAVDPGTVRDERAFLVTVTTRLAIDRLRRVRARRETYVGPWLPEPIATGSDPADAAADDTASIAMLVVLETLSPLERAVFVLREAFGFSHAEIGESLDRSEVAVRQLARRARAHVDERHRRFPADPGTWRDVTERFLRTSRTGDLAGLLALLAPGVTLVSDGGGKARAPLREIVGADRVARFFAAVAAEPIPDVGVAVVALNGAPGVIVSSGGVPITAIALDIGDGVVQRVWLVANPEKLGRLHAL